MYLIVLIYSSVSIMQSYWLDLPLSIPLGDYVAQGNTNEYVTVGIGVSNPAANEIEMVSSTSSFDDCFRSISPFSFTELVLQVHDY